MSRCGWALLPTQRGLSSESAALESQERTQGSLPGHMTGVEVTLVHFSVLNSLDPYLKDTAEQSLEAERQ